MISLRSCPEGKPESSPETSALTVSSDSTTNLPTLAYEQDTKSVSPDPVSSTRDEARPQDIVPAKSDATTEPPANGVYAGGNSFELGIFKCTQEARFALVEMRVQIRDQGLHLKPAIDLVVGRTQEITHSCGVVVGLLQEDGVVYSSRAGVATPMGELHFQANLFQFCLRTGRTVQLRDAQNHPLVGAACRKEGIGSLIIVPLFHNREVAGAIEFLFKERRLFSIGDVMDLELIAGIISESLSGAKTKPVENVESQVWCCPPLT